jgi:flagellar biosynthesis/type III secretory pathway protein FliH
MTIEALKKEILAQIVQIQNEAVLQKVRAMLESVSKENDLFYRVVKPVRSKITVEMLIKEQNYKGFDRKGFDHLVQKLDIQDPIEELLTLNTL